MKIAVLGYSGAGKSTLARALGEALGCPVLHLDRVNFLPGWRERDRGEARALVEAFLDRNGRSGWVIDGNYAALARARRLEEADRIVLFQSGRGRCLYQVWRRWRTNRGSVRESMAPGCPEKLDWEFVRWILWAGRSRAVRADYEAIRRHWSGKAAVLRTRRDAEAFLEAVRRQTGQTWEEGRNRRTDGA